MALSRIWVPAGFSLCYGMFSAAPLMAAADRRLSQVLRLLRISCQNQVVLSTSAFAGRLSAPRHGKLPSRSHILPPRWPPLLVAWIRCCGSCRLPVLFASSSLSFLCWAPLCVYSSSAGIFAEGGDHVYGAPQDAEGGRASSSSFSL